MKAQANNDISTAPVCIGRVLSFDTDQFKIEFRPLLLNEKSMWLTVTSEIHGIDKSALIEGLDSDITEEDFAEVAHGIANMVAGAISLGTYQQDKFKDCWLHMIAMAYELNANPTLSLHLIRPMMIQ